jgi:hypothetical protein
MPAWLPATFTVTVLPLQTVGVAGVTIGVVNGSGLIVTLVAADTKDAQPLTVEITV